MFSGVFMNDPARPVALITGSGRKRVGNVIAKHLAKLNFDIALHYHSSEDEAIHSRDEFRDHGVACEAYQADVSSELQVNDMIRGVESQFGRLDVLVTTASTWSASSLEETTADRLRQSFEVNTLGSFLVARTAGLLMVEQPEGGAIVTIGDWAIDRPYLDHAAYFISKGAIPTLTRVLARELGHRNSNVRVNCIHPGPVMLPPGSSEVEQQERVDSTLVKTADCPETVAHAVQFLIENQFVTGACIPVDGGRHMYALESVKAN